MNLKGLKKHIVVYLAYQFFFILYLVVNKICSQSWSMKQPVDYNKA